MRSPRRPLPLIALLLGGCAPGPGIAPPPGSTWSPGPPTVVINELLSGNDSVIRDEAGDFDDWVELVNASDAPVALAGWSLVEGGGELPLPDRTLDPGEHLLLWLDGDPASGVLHAEFSVKPGETVELLEPGGHVVDAVLALDLPDDLVQGRFPSGAPSWSESIHATPGQPNPADPGISRDPRDVLFPSDAVLRLDLELPQASWDALAADRDALVQAAVTYDGVTLDPVQLTIKGEAGSGRDITQKSAFRLNLDVHLPGQRLRGMEHLTLNNMVQDPSAVHELVTYRLMREAAVPAPRVAHVELWLNGAYRGLYLHVETIDDQFLQTWFDDPGGNLYEGAYGADVSLGLAPLMELDEIGPADVTDRSELDRLGELLAQPPSEALWPEFSDRISDRTLRMLAAEVVVQHWDGYFWYPNNYRIYHEPSVDRWTLIPWGTDQTFGSPGGDIHGPNGEIARWCLQVQSCRARYDAALVEMADRLLAMDVEGMVRAAWERNYELFEADPLREVPAEAMTDQASATVESSRAWAEAVRASLIP